VYFLPIETIGPHISLPLGSSAPHHLLLFRVEEISISRIIWKSKPNSQSANDGKYPLDDIYPSKAVLVEEFDRPGQNIPPIIKLAY